MARGASAANMIEVRTGLGRPLSSRSSPDSDRSLELEAQAGAADPARPCRRPGPVLQPSESHSHALCEARR